MAEQPLILEIQTGKHKGRRVRLGEEEVIIGRGEEARVRIASAEVSREHCKLVPLDGSILVVDLKSRNGTFVNGRPVDGQRMLSPGGTLTVGPLTFTLLGKEEESAGLSPGVALKGKSGTSDRLSDDDIANWLSDTEIPAAKPNALTETEINQHLPVPPDPVPATELESDSGLLAGWQPPGGRRREFKTVAEEAQEIIRRHFESLQEETAE